MESKNINSGPSFYGEMVRDIKNSRMETLRVLSMENDSSPPLLGEKATTSGKAVVGQCSTEIDDMSHNLLNRSWSSVSPSINMPPSLKTSLQQLPTHLHFDQREKVSVRLVENQGLVVEPDEEDSFTVRSTSLVRKNESPQRTGRIRRNTVGNDFRLTTPPPPTSKICSKLDEFTAPLKNSVISLTPHNLIRTSDENECKLKAGSPSLLEPQPNNLFNKTRHGNSSGSSSIGVSSMTPLMDGIKESHKIQVIIKPSSPTMIKSYSGSSIHLCCTLVFVFSASMFSSLTLLLAKVLESREHHPVTTAFWRYLGILVPSVPLTLFYVFRGRKKDKILWSIWPIHDMDKAANALALLIRGVLGATAVILRYCSLKYMTIANTSVISYGAPVFAAIIAPFCLKRDKHGIIPVFVGLLAGFAIFLISNPPLLSGAKWNNDLLTGVFLSSLSMVCSSGVLVSVRHLLERVHFSLMLLILGIWGTFEAGVLALSLEVLRVPHLLSDIVMMIGLAMLSFFGQLFLLLAMRMGHFGSVSVMKSCDIFLSFIWQYLFLKTKAESFEILSALLIIFSVWFICFRKWLGGLRSNDSVREKLSFLLH